MSNPRHLTTRRGFIATLGFGGVSLYGLWAGLGAAPSPLSLFGSHEENEAAIQGAHSAHGAPMEGPGVEEFRRMTAEFIERYATGDGAVHPRHILPDSTPRPDRAAHGVAQHAPAPSAPQPEIAHGAHGQPVTSPQHASEQDRLEVYLLAEKWFYEPAHLRLDAGVAYRFRMMASDVSHGASIQFGRGGRLVRLRPGRVVELQQTFTKPGTYLLYCTVYCGQAHDFMQGRIEVI